MLFRRSKTYIFFFLVLISYLIADENLDSYRKLGQKVGKSKICTEFSKEDLEAITPKELHGQSFDHETAHKQLNSKIYPHMENIPRSDVDPNITATIENAENTLKQSESLPDTIEKCLFEQFVFPVTLQHFLTVQVIHHDQVSRKNKVCMGHHSSEKSDHASEDKKKKKKKFSSDPTIKSFEVYIEKGNIGHRDKVISRWTHVDNASTCDIFRTIEVKESSEKWEEIDTWHVENSELLSSLDCTLIKTTQGQPEKRVIGGREVFRSSWSKTQEMQCVNYQQRGCEFLKQRNCVPASENCIKYSENRCVLWEKFFKCRSHNSQVPVGNIYGSDPSLWETKYQPNQSLSDVSTKLAVFDEMKRELQNSKASDIRSVRLFSGSDQKCSKSIVDNLMYDCCFDMDGLATQLKLSKCTADEIALAESCRKGLCHYIGEKKEKFLDLWVSRKEYVFCVFPSKLSRVFQEEARRQLNIDWGNPDRPDCRGLTQEEIKRVDFSKLNLLEAFEIPKEIDQDEKIQKVEERLKQRLNAGLA